MFHRFNIALPRMETSFAIMMGLLVVNLVFNILANAAFKVSAFSPTWRGFLIGHSIHLPVDEPPARHHPPLRWLVE